jgi:hypothetical protein
MAWGVPFNGETSLRLMAEPLQGKKTSEQSPPKTTPFLQFQRLLSIWSSAFCNFAIKLLVKM